MEGLVVGKDRGVAVIDPALRRLDAGAAPAFRQAVLQVIESGETRLVLDLAGVEFIDSSGLGALVSILKNLGARGGLAVCNAQPAVLGLFKLTRMDKVFPIVAGREDAVARLAG